MTLTGFVTPISTSFGDARRAIAPLLSGIDPKPTDFSAYLEAHIEQGPKLDEADEAAGVVTAIVGSRQLAVTFQGEQNHAGTLTPMARRRDAVRGFYRYASELEGKFTSLATDDTVWTIGQVYVEPNAPSIVPGRIKFTVQWRDASNDRLNRMQNVAVEHAETIGRLARLEGHFERAVCHPAPGHGCKHCGAFVRGGGNYCAGIMAANDLRCPARCCTCRSTYSDRNALYAVKSVV